MRSGTQFLGDAGMVRAPKVMNRSSRPVTYRGTVFDPPAPLVGLPHNTGPFLSARAWRWIAGLALAAIVIGGVIAAVTP